MIHGYPMGLNVWALECQTCGPFAVCTGSTVDVAARQHALSHLAAPKETR